MEVFEKLCDLIRLRITRKEIILPEDNFKDMGYDSVDWVFLIMQVEKEFNIALWDSIFIGTVEDLALYIEKKIEKPPEDQKWIYESPDNGKTVYRRPFDQPDAKREKVEQKHNKFKESIIK